MTKTEYLLICLMGECAELQKECSKALRLGLDEIDPNYGYGEHKVSVKDKIIIEYADVVGVMEALVNADILERPLGAHIINKIDKLEKWMKYSKDKGILNG